MPEWKYAVTYRRNLPHWQPHGTPIFLTWRLTGSLPADVAAALAQEREVLQRDSRWLDGNTDWALVQQKRLFAKSDDALHTTLRGPMWLRQPEIAQIVREALHYSESTLYRLYAYVIMANHVHVLLEPALDEKTRMPMPLRIITQKLKGATARYANLALQRSGAFWEHESYDHWIRNPQEFERAAAYIVNNPVKAGLVEDWRDCPWTWIAEDLLA